MRLVYSLSDHVTHAPTPILQGVAMVAVEHGRVQLQSGWSAGPQIEPWRDVRLSQRITAQHSHFFFGQLGRHVPHCNEG